MGVSMGWEGCVCWGGRAVSVRMRGVCWGGRGVSVGVGGVCLLGWEGCVC